MSVLVVLLLVIYQLKHWLADYPLQTPWMLGKFKGGWAWVAPLAAHAAVHGGFTFAICAVLMSTGWKFALLMAAFDFIVHFTMDRIKASSRLMGRWKPLTANDYAEATRLAAGDMGPDAALPDDFDVRPFQAMGRKMLRDNRWFWYALGIDQAVHHLTHYFIIWMLVH